MEKEPAIEIPRPGRAVRGSRTGAPIMALLDLLGRRWAMGVLWVLCQNGPLTFRSLAEQCGSISPTVLNSRLKELRAARFVAKSAKGYVATAFGRRVYDQLVPLGATAKEWAILLEEH